MRTGADWVYCGVVFVWYGVFLTYVYINNSILKLCMYIYIYYVYIEKQYIISQCSFIIVRQYYYYSVLHPDLCFVCSVFQYPLQIVHMILVMSKIQSKTVCVCVCVMRLGTRKCDGLIRRHGPSFCESQDLDFRFQTLFPCCGREFPPG